MKILNFWELPYIWTKTLTGIIPEMSKEAPRLLNILKQMGKN